MDTITNPHRARIWAKSLAAALALAACTTGCSSTSSSSSNDSQTVTTITPGNSILSAAKASIGMTVAGEIKKGGPSNFYFFENPGKLRDIVLVRLVNTSTTLRPSIKIYNADRSQLTNKYDGTPGANLDLPLSLDPGQAIYVEVEPYDSMGTYNLSALPQKAYDANEPNDDQLHPTPAKFGGSVEGSIMDDKDNDWFHFTAATGPKVTIALENLSTTLRPSVIVFNANKSQIGYKYDGTPGAGLDFVVDVPAGQDFYVKIEPYSSTGQYRLSARAAVLAPDMASALKAKGLIDLYGVYFNTDQTFVRPESATTLGEIASLLKADPSLRLEIAGHTDNTGAKDHNMALSQGRAEAVVQALVGQYGIDAGRLVPKGYGDSKPVAPNDTAANKALNRRVELHKL